MQSLAGIILFFFSATLAAQSNAIKVDLIRPVLSLFNDKPAVKASYEHAFSSHITVQLTLEDGRFAAKKIFYSNPFRQSVIYKLRGTGIIPEIRYYPFTSLRQAPQGWFIGVYYSHYFVKENYHLEKIDFSTTGDVINTGLSAGFKHGRNTFIEYLIGYAPFQTSIWNQPNQRSTMDPRQDYRHIPEQVNRLRIEFSVGFLF